MQAAQSEYPAEPTPVPGSDAAPAPGAPRVSPEGLARLGAMLAGRFEQYEKDRTLAEQKWAKNARQYLGVYDPDIEKLIPANRSKAYPRITRVKCVSMLSRLMNLLFPADDKNWTVNPSAVPDLDQEDLQPILDGLMPPDGQQAPPDAVIEEAIRKFARERGRRMELEIEDQLQELGGCRLIDYVQLCRKVLASGIQYGAGVLRGPFIEEQEQRYWQVANGRLTALTRTAYRPRFEWVSLWDYYPDMGAKTLDQMDGQFLRQVMSRHQLIALKKRADFKAEQIDKFLRQKPTGNYRRRLYETELRALGVQNNTSQSESNKFEAVVWDGYCSGQELADAGVLVPADKLTDDVRCQVWLLENTVIKAELDPWTGLDGGEEIHQYHHFIFEEDESFLLGNGLPAIVRDSQMGVCAATRMVLDNGSVQRNFEVNTKLLSPTMDVSGIDPDKIWYRDDDDAQTVNVPAVRVIDLPLKLGEMQQVITLFQNFADQETFVSAATGGDLQRGPSEPFRTAAGASMLRGDAALPFKDVVRNFDAFTESVIGALLIFNRNFNTNPGIRGDFKPIARGATSLIAKEVQGMQLDSFAQTLTEEEKPYVNGKELARARARVRDLDSKDVVYDDAKCEQIDQQRREDAQRAQQLQDEALRAEIRKTLADALKSITQAGKNSASATASTANVILAALEKGLNPDMLDMAGAEADGEQPTTAGADGGTGAAAGAGAAGAPQQPGTGLGGLEAAVGGPLGGARPQAAAMPTS